MNVSMRPQSKAGATPRSNNNWKGNMMSIEQPSFFKSPTIEHDKSNLGLPFKQELSHQKPQQWPRKNSFEQEEDKPTMKILVSQTLKSKASLTDERMVRRSMVRVIEKRLRQTIESDDSPVPTLAKALEQHLYKTAPSFREYADSKTLNSRLRLVTVALMARRRKQQQKLSRTDMLLQVLGEERFQEAAQLSKQVRMLRLQRLVRDCPKCKQDGTCPIDGGSLSNNIPFTAQGTVPEPVQALFFKTELVQAFDTTPAERIRMINWEDLLDEARSNMERYQEWDLENSILGDDSSLSERSTEGRQITAV